MAQPVKILGLAGSLREKSFNKLVLRAAVELAPEGCAIETVDLPDLPGFNQDREKEPPAAVVELKRRVRAADAVLFVTPEYNYSVPGVLKNTIDWVSRPFGDNAWLGRCAAVLGASMGVLGTARAQSHLRQTLLAFDMPTVGQPEVLIAQAHKRFDEAGALTDDLTKKLIRLVLENLVKLVRRQQAP